ncbi:zinc finger protein 710-like [Galendromus occidentalis]|uniref:Zinc finger protein 710-like n=1 Tax=Galendromus occidentalis TaxID=34638 RepID=A0AAJ6VZ20_9ACAR|nr:zinc finger protein 710-like [Galendromus occidentalis]
MDLDSSTPLHDEEILNELKSEIIDESLLDDTQDTQETEVSLNETNEDQVDDDSTVFCILCDAEVRGKWAYKKHITKHQWDAQRGQDPTDEIFTPYRDTTEDVPVNFKLSCAVCTFTSNVPRELERHYHTHVIGYKCLLCDFTTLHRTRLAAHYPTHKREKARLECHICNATLSSTSALKKHIARHSEGTICCKLCDYKTYDRFLLREHMATKHNEVMKKFKCEHCDEEFGTFRRFFQHRQEAHKGFIYKRQVDPKYCDKCDFQTTKVKEMNVHKLMHQGLVEIFNNGRYHCKIQGCTEAFNSATKYELHFTKVHDKVNLYGLATERVHSCPIEGCTFSTVKESHLKLHMHVHRTAPKTPTETQEKKKRAQGNCPICLAKFSDKYKVRSHMETVHSNEKPFVCQFCCYKTAYKYNMRIHMKKLHKMIYNVKTDTCEPIETEAFQVAGPSFQEYHQHQEYESGSEYEPEWE